MQDYYYDPEDTPNLEIDIGGASNNTPKLVPLNTII